MFQKVYLVKLVYSTVASVQCSLEAILKLHPICSVALSAPEYETSAGEKNSKPENCSTEI